MTALAVLAGEAADSAGDVVPVIASLPISLVGVAPGQRPDLVAIDGGSGWPERTIAAVAEGARGLLIVRPAPVPSEEVPQRPGVPVVIDYPFAGNPVLASASTAFVDWPDDAMIEVAAVVPHAADLDSTLIDQLATLRRAGHPAAELTSLTWDHSGYYLRGSSTSGCPLLLTAHVTTGVPRALQIRGLAGDVAVELTLPDPSTARPAVLVRTSPSGATTSPTLWETSHRATWRRLHAAVTHAQPTNDLAELGEDLGVATQALARPEDGPISDRPPITTHLTPHLRKDQR